MKCLVPITVCAVLANACGSLKFSMGSSNAERVNKDETRTAKPTPQTGTATPDNGDVLDTIAESTAPLEEADDLQSRSAAEDDVVANPFPDVIVNDGLDSTALSYVPFLMTDGQNVAKVRLAVGEECPFGVWFSYNHEKTYTISLAPDRGPQNICIQWESVNGSISEVFRTTVTRL